MSTATPYIVRFNNRQRFEHALNLVVFVLLCATGLPQKFFQSGWAQTMLDFFGGVDRARFIHRVCGITMAVATVAHFGFAIAAIAGKGTRLSMIPEKKDFTDAIDTLKYYLGISDKHPLYDRFEYKQKFEYWGVVMGGVIMVTSGFTLYFPTIVARYLPGELIPAAKVMHSNEGLMAFLVIAIWHMFNSVLAPEVFPIDTAIFTGKISRERMLHEHPLELARLEGRPVEELLAEAHAHGHGHGGGGRGHGTGEGKADSPHARRNVG
jgi:cytochrome b subunit of formate dehydrogenase